MLRSEPFPVHHSSPLWIWVIWYRPKNPSEIIPIHTAAQIHFRLLLKGIFLFSVGDTVQITSNFFLFPFLPSPFSSSLPASFLPPFLFSFFSIPESCFYGEISQSIIRQKEESFWSETVCRNKDRVKKNISVKHTLKNSFVIKLFFVNNKTPNWACLHIMKDFTKFRILFAWKKILGLHAECTDEILFSSSQKHRGPRTGLEFPGHKQASPSTLIFSGLWVS